MSGFRTFVYATTAVAFAGLASAAASYQLPVSTTQPVTTPGTYDSYKVMCERGGATFTLGGGLLQVDPDNLAVTSYEGPVIDGVDTPDRYEAARCSRDGGRTWGDTGLGFYVPNFGQSSVINTGFNDYVFGEQRSPEHYEVPAEDEDELTAMFDALGNALGIRPSPDAESPKLPLLPSLNYTIVVKYRPGVGAEPLTLRVPAVLGAPSLVSLPFSNGTVETLNVNIGPSQTTSTEGTVTSAGYALTVERISPSLNATCNPLEADVGIELQVADVMAPGYPNNVTDTIAFGYETFGLGTRPHAPSKFEVKYESSTASTGPTRNDFFVSTTQTPSCNDPGPLNVVGQIVSAGDPASASDDINLRLKVAMPVMTAWNLRRETDPTSRMWVRSNSVEPIGELRAWGMLKGREINASMDGLPQKLELCAHAGNGCNRHWRTDRNSESGAHVLLRDAADKAAPRTITYQEKSPTGNIDAQLTFSDLWYDMYLGVFGIRETALLPGITGDYPKFFFFDTNAEYIGGHFRQNDGGKKLAIEMPGYKTRSWSREVVADKKGFNTYIRIDYWNYIECGEGFLIDVGAPGLVNKYVGRAFCRW